MKKSAPLPPPLSGVEPIQRLRLYEEVSRQLQAMIADGRFKPGDQLPPERELVRRFQVSRGSVRDAIRSLEHMGLVRSRQGGGRVVQPAPQPLALAFPDALAPTPETVGEILEIRKIVEPAFAARAAVRATPQEIASLQDVLRRQQEKTRREESTVEEDAEFHYLVALASRNSLVDKVVAMLLRPMRETMERSLQVDGRLESSLKGHRRVLRAILRRSPRAAANAMRQHIAQIEALMLEGIAVP